MKICFLTTKINFEGAGGSVPDLDCKVRSMQGLGNDAFVVTLFSEKNVLPTLPYRVDERSIRGTKTWFAVQREIFTTLRAYHAHADVFHVEGHFLYGAALYRLFGGRPIVVFYNREMTVWESGRSVRALLRRGVEKLLCRTLGPVADCHYFTTPFLAKQYADFGLRLKPEQTFVLVDFLDPTDMKATIAHGQSHRRSDIVSIFASGRMVREKGFDILVEAVALLPETIRNRTHVMIGGDGPERERVIELAHTRNVSDVVSFPGWMSKELFWQKLGVSDIFVLPRWRIEIPSIIVMEALALGIPTIAPGGGGVEWMAKGGMVPFADANPASLAQRLATLIESEAERARVSRAAHERWKALDHRVRTPDFVRIFQSALGAV